MHSIESLEALFGHKLTKDQLAGHVADSISAQEQLQRTARQEGDVDLLEQSIDQISKLKVLARNNGITSDTHPGIFKSR